MGYKKGQCHFISEFLRFYKKSPFNLKLELIANDEEEDFFSLMKNVFNHKSYKSLLFLFLIVSTAVQVNINGIFKRF